MALGNFCTSEAILCDMFRQIESLSERVHPGGGSMLETFVHAALVCEPV
jgi:hypothetical protein